MLKDDASILSSDTLVADEAKKSEEGKSEGGKRRLSAYLPKGYDAKKAVDWDVRTNYHISPY